MKPAVEWISRPSRPERALPFEAGDEIVRQLHPLERRAEHELAGVKDERIAVLDLHELRQPLLLALDVDVGIAVVAKDPKQAVDANIEARRLHQRRVVRIDHDPALVDQSRDRPVGENHGAILTRERIRRVPDAADAVRSVIRCPCFTAKWTRTSVSALDGTRLAGQNGAVGPRSWRSCSSLVIVVVMGARFVGDKQATTAGAKATPAAAPATSVNVARRGPGRSPSRSAACTSPARSRRCPGKFREYVGYKRYGLNTIELDVKDEGGEIGFATPNVPLAHTVGATRLFYNPKALVALAHRKGIYMIGRVVCFQDPNLARERPDLAIQRPDGSVWTT